MQELEENTMKNYTQVYVKNSFEAAETYCKAFGAEITIAHKYKWETMTFNVFEMETEEAVYNAFQALPWCHRMPATVEVRLASRA